MAPKKATEATAPKAKKPASGDSHPTYKEMIKEAIITLKERNGSSRQSIKKYILSNKGVTDDKQFASQLNRALRSGVEKGEFAQPKGPSGPVKLAHKETAKKASPPKDSVKKEVKPKTETKKKAATTATTKKPATKKAAPKKTTAAKPKAKANTSSKRKTAPATAAPAVVDKPTTLTKTKSGRVAKTTTPAAKKAPAKKAAAKKAAPKKAAPKKTAPPAVDA